MREQLREFLIWWARGLAAIVPRRWRQANPVRRQWLRISTRPGGFRVSLWRGAQAAGQEHEIKLDRDGRMHIPRPLRKTLGAPRIPKILRLGPGEALCRGLVLPAAARDKLDEILPHEIERRVPFYRADVEMAYSVTDAKSETLEITLAVARKELIASVTKPLRAAGITLHAIDVEGVPYVGTGLNLLPLETSGASRPPVFTRAALAIALILAALVYPWRTTVRYETEAAQLRAVAEEKRSAVADINELRRTAETRFEGLTHLASARTDYVPFVELLGEVTERLPDNAWIRRLEMTGTRLTLHGESHDATALPRLLDASPRLSAAQPVSAFIRNAGTGADRFTIAAQIAAQQRP